MKLKSCPQNRHCLESQGKFALRVPEGTRRDRTEIQQTQPVWISPSVMRVCMAADHRAYNLPILLHRPCTVCCLSDFPFLSNFWHRHLQGRGHRGLLAGLSFDSATLSSFFFFCLVSLLVLPFFSLSFFFLLNNYSFCLHKIHSNVSLRDRRGFFCIARVEQLEDGTGQCYVQPAATRHWFVCFRGAYGPRKLLTFLREGGTGICHHAFVWHFNFLLFTTIPRLYCFNLIGYWLSIYFDLLYLFGKN